MMILNNRDEISFFFFHFLLFPFVLSPLQDCMLFLVMEDVEEEGMI